MSAALPEQSPHMEALLKPEEVAPLFKVKPGTVKTWARQRKIPSIKTPGGEIRVRPSDVAAMLASPIAAANEDGPALAIAAPGEPLSDRPLQEVRP